MGNDQIGAIKQSTREPVVDFLALQMLCAKSRDDANFGFKFAVRIL
ncbi:hypothetical protein J121_477 [Qipengyuania citrea LAMA 915]|uniref:Uncharacterized protein n=1 Tax=Qipengyuania citrea LAMA 915 TaxID=1306953 RepID=A0A0L1KI87_9SPHN|nr:hypothetical protein J121_477 [Qipengyuania citrea LAMA 915]